MSLISVRAQLTPSQCPGSSPEEGQEFCLHREAEPVPSPAQESGRAEPVVLPPTYSSLTPQILKELKTKRLPTGSFSLPQFLAHSRALLLYLHPKIQPSFSTGEKALSKVQLIAHPPRRDNFKPKAHLTHRCTSRKSFPFSEAGDRLETQGRGRKKKRNNNC